MLKIIVPLSLYLRNSYGKWSHVRYHNKGRKYVYEGCIENITLYAIVMYWRALEQLFWLGWSSWTMFTIVKYCFGFGHIGMSLWSSNFYINLQKHSFRSKCQPKYIFAWMFKRAFRDRSRLMLIWNEIFLWKQNRTFDIEMFTLNYFMRRDILSKYNPSFLEEIFIIFNK